MSQNSTITAKFEEKWLLIEKEFDLLKKERLLPFSFEDIDGTITSRTEEDFSNQLTTLKKEKFTISICGIVKAGKSTLLNALLFQEDILPAFDTPMTAKLNFIEHTEDKNHFIVNFYSTDEWEEVHRSFDEEDSTQLSERVQLCADEYDIHDEHCIGAEPRREDDLKKLEEYVSDPKTKNGKFTPFVKDVHIFINNDNIRDVRIVDTPGLNDPNVINSRETIKWIKNTHALIFLLPPKSLDASSLDFFDTHLLGTQPTNRIWVINKIDDISEDDLRKSISYLRDLGKQEDFRKKNLFGRDEIICGYSALIFMLRCMKKKGISLNEDQIFHLEKVEEDFNPDPHNLAEIVGERLYKNTGEKRIKAGFSAINMLYSQHINAANQTIIRCEMTIADASKDDNKLKREISIIEEKQNEFTRQLVELKIELADVVFKTLKENLGVPATKSFSSLDKKMKLQIDDCVNAKALRNIPYAFQKEYEKIFDTVGEINEGIQMCSNVLCNKLMEVCKRIKILFAQNEIEGSINFAPIDEITSIEFDADNLLENLHSSVRDALPSNWFTEVFTSKSNMRESTKEEINKALVKAREYVDTIVKNMKVNVENQISKSFNDFNISIDKSCLLKRNILETDKNKRTNTLKKAKAELDEATQTKRTIEEMQRTFKRQFQQEIWLTSK